MPMPGVAGYPMPMPGVSPMPGVGGYGPPGSVGPQSLTLRDRANEAFRNGKDGDAFKLLYASALVDEEAAERLPEEFRWIANRKKPALAVRWGLGVIYNPPRGFTGHPSPVGYVEPEAANNSGYPGGAPGGIPGAPNAGQPQQNTRKVFGQRNRGQQNQPGSTPNQQPAANKPAPSHPPGDPAGFLDFYTGEVGELIVESLSERIEAGNYGPVLQQAMESYVSSPAPGGNAAYPGMPMMAPGMAPGMVPPGAPGVPGAPGFPGAPNQNNNPKPGSFEPGSIIPGVVMLGEGSESKLIETAEEHEVDFVILFEVSVRKSNKDVTNNTKFRVMSIDKAKLPEAAAAVEGQDSRAIFASGTINNLRVDKARDKDAADPLAAEIESFEQAIDAQVVVTPLAEKVNTKEVALKRAAFLAEQAENQLANLAEIRHYQAAELISDKEAVELFVKILGKSDAEKLLKGKTESDRAAALRKWLPKA